MGTMTANPTRNPPQTPPATTIPCLQQPTADHRSSSKPQKQTHRSILQANPRTRNPQQPTVDHRSSSQPNPQILVSLCESQTHRSSFRSANPKPTNACFPRPSSILSTKYQDESRTVSTAASLDWSGWTKHAAKRSPEPGSSSRISQRALHETTRRRPAQILSRWLGWLGVAGMAWGGWAESRGREQRAEAERRGREREKRKRA